MYMPTFEEKLIRVTVSLTAEEIQRLDHYRARDRLPRGAALRIAAMNTIPQLPATGLPGEEAEAAAAARSPNV